MAPATAETRYGLMTHAACHPVTMRYLGYYIPNKVSFVLYSPLLEAFREAAFVGARRLVLDELRALPVPDWEDYDVDIDHKSTGARIYPDDPPLATQPQPDREALLRPVLRHPLQRKLNDHICSIA